MIEVILTNGRIITCAWIRISFTKQLVELWAGLEADLPLCTIPIDEVSEIGPTKHITEL